MSASILTTLASIYSALFANDKLVVDLLDMHMPLQEVRISILCLSKSIDLMYHV